MPAWSLIPHRLRRSRGSLQNLPGMALHGRAEVLRPVPAPWDRWCSQKSPTFWVPRSTPSTSTCPHLLLPVQPVPAIHIPVLQHLPAHPWGRGCGAGPHRSPLLPLDWGHGHCVALSSTTPSVISPHTKLTITWMLEKTEVSTGIPEGFPSGCAPSDATRCSDSQQPHLGGSCVIRDLRQRVNPSGRDPGRGRTPGWCHLCDTNPRESTARPHSWIHPSTEGSGSPSLSFTSLGTGSNPVPGWMKSNSSKFREFHIFTPPVHSISKMPTSRPKMASSRPQTPSPRPKLPKPRLQTPQNPSPKTRPP